MDIQTLKECVILALCQVPRQPNEIPFFLRVLQCNGETIGRSLPFTEDVITEMDQTIKDLRQRELLDRGAHLMTTAKGRDAFKELRTPILREFRIDVERISEFTTLINQLFEVSFGQLLPPENPAFPGLRRALTLKET